MRRITNNWISPYQQERYNLSLESLDVNCKEFRKGKKKIFLNDLSSNKLTAWELNGFSKEKAKILINSNFYDVWMYEGIKNFDEVDWVNSKYYTLIVEKNDNLQKIYSSSNIRNIKRAKLNKLKFVSGSSEYIQKSMKLFAKNKILRGNLDIRTFAELVKNTENNNVGMLHSILYKNRVIASALVLKSSNVANIRYIATDYAFQFLRPVNFLYNSIIEHYLSKGWSYVDLSGIASPEHPDKKLVNITRFKKGFSKRVVIFSKL